MKIGAGVGNTYASLREQVPAAKKAVTAPQSNASGGSEPEHVRQVDFSSMTRQDMRDWVNTRLHSGQMTLEESRPFMAMSMKIPVGRGVSAELPPESDSTRYDFAQLVLNGIQGALSRNDRTTLEMLETARAIMQGQQGQTIGISIRA